MKKLAVFITYFQSPFQFVHVYQFLDFEDFFEKSVGWFNLMSIFLTLNYFLRKNMRRSAVFMTYFNSSFRFVHH